MPTDPGYLQPDEARLADERRHPLSVVDVALGATVTAILVAAGLWFLLFRVLGEGPLRDLAVPAFVVIAALWLGSLVAAWFRVVTSRYIVTDTRVYRSFGRLRFDLLQTTYDKVTDLHVRQSLFGRLFGFGDVTLQTAGVGLTLGGVRDPFGMKRRVEAARTAFLATLVREYREDVAARPASPIVAEEAAAAPGEAAPGPAPDAVLWRGRPVGWSLVGPTVNLVVMGLVGLTFLGAGAIAGAGPFSLLGPLLIVVAVFGFVGSYVQYRHTRYEVTPSGVVVTSGWLSRRRVETTYDKVTDVATYQGFLGRIFDFGNITVNTAGSERAPVVFRSLAQPDQVKGLIDEARRQRDSGKRRAL